MIFERHVNGVLVEVVVLVEDTNRGTVSTFDASGQPNGVFVRDWVDGAAVIIGPDGEVPDPPPRWLIDATGLG